jgi:hypothetical protein
LSENSLHVWPDLVVLQDEDKEPVDKVEKLL